MYFLHPKMFILAITAYKLKDFNIPVRISDQNSYKLNLLTNYEKAYFPFKKFIISLWLYQALYSVFFIKISSLGYAIYISLKKLFKIMETMYVLL